MIEAASSIGPGFEARTLVEILRWRAVHQSDQVAYKFLVDGATEETQLTYRELDGRARAIAARLQDLAPPGTRALLLFPSDLDYIAAFFGCLYAAVIAVPTYPPRRNRPNAALFGLLADCQAAVVLTTRSISIEMEAQRTQTPALRDLHWVETDGIADALANDWREPDVRAGTLAFLQYTSGSSGTPKGVMVSHGNLLHNELMVRQSFGHSDQTVVVGWLPLFHDMGLIGNVLQSMYVGGPCILMAPAAFLQRPCRWLQAISRYKATTSGAPNFAYDLCTRKVSSEQTATLDLSSWDVAFCGAEPVRALTIERFAARFAPFGFRRESFYPCYGLAEATLFVSGGAKALGPVLQAAEGPSLERNRAAGAPVPVGSGRAVANVLVGCGHAWDTQQIVIVDPESHVRCPQGQVGEIWVSGRSVAQGYWNRPDETHHTFRACLAGSGEGPFLRTGDLGFMDGDLFVTGRLKDLIIIHGRNHYPHDIELTVQDSDPALEEARGAAFSIDIEGEERLVVAHEIRSACRRGLNAAGVIGNIRQAVARHHDLQVFEVVLLKSGGLPRTSSGKVRRQTCRADFIAGTLPVLEGHPESAGPTARWLDVQPSEINV